MLVRLTGNVIVERLVQFRNASLPILSRLLVNEMLDSVVLSANTDAPIPVTRYPSSVLGIVMLVAVPEYAVIVAFPLEIV